MKPYHLRHSIGTLTFQATGGNLALTQAMLDHADAKTTLRYVTGAVSAAMATAGELLAKAIDSRPAYVKPAGVVPAPAPRRRPKVGQIEAIRLTGG